MSDNQESKRKRNKWLVFATMPLQMGVTIYVFYLLGTWLDKLFENSGEWYMKSITLFGVAVSLYQFIKQANQISKND